MITNVEKTDKQKSLHFIITRVLPDLAKKQWIIKPLGVEDYQDGIFAESLTFIPQILFNYRGEMASAEWEVLWTPP